MEKMLTRLESSGFSQEKIVGWVAGKKKLVWRGKVKFSIFFLLSIPFLSLVCSIFMFILLHCWLVVIIDCFFQLFLLFSESVTICKYEKIGQTLLLFNNLIFIFHLQVWNLLVCFYSWIFFLFLNQFEYASMKLASCFFFTCCMLAGFWLGFLFRFGFLFFPINKW